MANITTTTPVSPSELIKDKQKIYGILEEALKQNRIITRGYLMMAIGRPDTSIRALIRSLRDDGLIICSSAHSIGYYLPHDEETFRSFATEYRAKALKMLKIAELQELRYGSRSISLADFETTKPAEQTENMRLMNIVYSILRHHQGMDDAVTRQSLVVATGRTDKKVRDVIKYLREDGKIICSSARARGYYIPSSEIEFRQYINEYRAKAYKMLAIIDKQEQSFRSFLKTA